MTTSDDTCPRCGAPMPDYIATTMRRYGKSVHHDAVQCDYAAGLLQRAEKAEAERNQQYNVLAHRTKLLQEAEAERDEANEQAELQWQQVKHYSKRAETAEAERDRYRAALERIEISCGCGCQCCKATEHRIHVALEADK